MSTQVHPLTQAMKAAPGTTVPMISPDGRVGDIPVEKVDAATQAGFKRGVDMQAPTGEVGTIPLERSEEALAKNFRPISASPNMQSDSPTVAGALDIATHQKLPTIEQMEQSNRDAGKFGADSMIGQELLRPAAQLAETHVLPALKSIPYAGKVISAIDEAPGVVGKAVRGATVGGAAGGAEGLVRGHGLQGSLNDAAKGAAYGGALGVALPAIHKLSGYAPPAPAPELGAPLPSYEDYAVNRGTEISRAMRQQPDAFAPSPPEPPAVYPGAPLPSAEKFYETRGNEINRAMRQQPDAFAPPAPPPPEVGSPENPGFMSKLPARLPPNLRGDPFSPTSPTASAPIGSIPSEEGVPGSLPKPSGRLVVLPQEAQALDQLQKIAKARASQHGMQYAAGMRPAGGGRVPLTPTGITTEEFPGPRPHLDPFSPISSEDLEQLVRQLQ